MVDQVYYANRVTSSSSAAVQASYQRQQTWFIDPANSSGLASDSNDGLVSSRPLLTDAARQARIGSIWNIDRDITIQYMSNVPANDPIGGVIHFKAGGGLRIKGTATQSYSGSGGLDSRTLLNRATNTPYDITQAAMGTGRVGQRVRFTTGAAAGMYCWLAKDLAAGRYRISPPSSYNTAAASLGITVTQAAPAATDQFVIETLSTIARLKLVVLSHDWSTAPFNQGVSIIFQDFDYVGGTSGGPQVVAVSQIANLAPIWYGCALGSAQIPGISIASRHSGTTYGGPTTMLGPAFFGSLLLGSSNSIQGGNEALVDYDTLIQGSSTFGLRARRGGLIRLGTCGIFDSTGDGIVVEEGQVKSVSLFAGAEGVYGSGNASYGIRVRPPGQYIYTTKTNLTITGGTNDTRVGGIDKAYAALPYVDTANNNLAAIAANT